MLHQRDCPFNITYSVYSTKCPKDFLCDFQCFILKVHLRIHFSQDIGHFCSINIQSSSTINHFLYTFILSDYWKTRKFSFIIYYFTFITPCDAQYIIIDVFPILCWVCSFCFILFWFYQNATKFLTTFCIWLNHVQVHDSYCKRISIAFICA